MPIPALASLRLLLRFALDGLAAQRGRSLLTITGMAIGTASVVAVISIGLVGRDYVVGLIEGIGTNLVIIYSKDEGTSPEQLTFGDIDALVKRVPYVSAMAPVLHEMQNFSVRNEEKSMRVLGTPPAYASVRNLVVVSGRFLGEADEVTGAKVAIVSKKLAEEAFGSTDIRGRSLRLFGLRFPVVGVFREAVESAAAVEQSEAAGLAAIIPFQTFRNLSDAHHLTRSAHVKATFF